MRKYLVEFIGTFFLVLVIGLTTTEGPGSGVGNLAPIAIGSILMVMVFAGGHISGAHYNPAVTVAVAMRTRMPVADIIGYIVAQLLGAIVAALLIDPFGGQVVDPSARDILPSLLAEILGTFALVYVILNVAVSRDNLNNHFYGLAIGFTVMACAYAFGGISGGAFNPAVAIGATTMGAFLASDIWIYLLGNFGAAVLAALIFAYVDSSPSPESNS